jgi:hypothetical protein
MAIPLQSVRNQSGANQPKGIRQVLVICVDSTGALDYRMVQLTQKQGEKER